MTSQNRWFVVFDCDGTLVDSQGPIIAAAVAAWAEQGLAPPDSSAIRQVVGLPLEQALERVLQLEGHNANLAMLVADYKAAFNKKRHAGEGDEPLYPGILEVIEGLESRSALLGVATGKSRRGLEATLAQHDLSARFATLQTADDAPGKPRPDMLHQAMAAVGATADETLMIGDTSFDMLMARAAGVAAIGVGWGYHDQETLEQAGAMGVVGTAEMLLARILEHWGGT